jgi:periplasmic divalent cation tolerance protein
MSGVDATCMHSMLYTTMESEREAVSLAQHLLDKRLIACANVFRIRSICRWKDKFLDEGEFAVIMKTRTALAKKAIAEAAKVHSYEVPCLVSYQMGEGFPAFLKWIDEETRQPKK